MVRVHVVNTIVGLGYGSLHRGIGRELDLQSNGPIHRFPLCCSLRGDYYMGMHVGHGYGSMSF